MATHRTAFNKQLRARRARILRDNKRWEGASKAQRRVKVCQDALDWLDMGMMTMRTSAYLDVTTAYGSPISVCKSRQLDVEILERIEAPGGCFCCGVGALLLSTVMRYDDFELPSSCVIGLDKSISMSQGSTGSGLKSLFTRRQLAMIEVAFERWADTVSSFHRLLDRDVRFACYEFGKKFEYAKDRFIAIMQNIIQNKGTFRP